MSKTKIGCLIALALLALFVVLAVRSAPRLAKRGMAWANAQMADAAKTAAFEAAWMPPSATPDASWFPTAVGDWKSDASEDFTSLPALEIERGGRRATYRHGTRTVEVSVVRANELEHEAIFARAQKALSARNGTRLTTSAGHQMRVRIGSAEQTRMWWIKGWIFIFQAQSETDPADFAQTFLETIDQHEKPEAEPPTSV